MPARKRFRLATARFYCHERQELSAAVDSRRNRLESPGGWEVSVEFGKTIKKRNVPLKNYLKYESL